MAYKKTNWQDTLRDAQGNVIQKGTPLNAQALGKIEDGIVQAEQKIDTEIQQVTTQLAQKADQASINSTITRVANVETGKRDKSVKINNADLDISSDDKKIKLVNLSDEVQQALTGNAPALSTIPDGAVGETKYADGSFVRRKSKTSLGSMQDGIYSTKEVFMTVDGTNIKVKFSESDPRLYYKNTERRDSLTLTVFEYVVPHNYSLVYDINDLTKLHIKDTNTLTTSDHIIITNYNGSPKVNNIKIANTRRLNDIVYCVGTITYGANGTDLQVKITEDARVYVKSADLRLNSALSTSYTIANNQALFWNTYSNTISVKSWDALNPDDLVLFGNSNGEAKMNNIGAIPFISNNISVHYAGTIALEHNRNSDITVRFSDTADKRIFIKTNKGKFFVSLSKLTYIVDTNQSLCYNFASNSLEVVGTDSGMTNSRLLLVSNHNGIIKNNKLTIENIETNRGYAVNAIEDFVVYEGLEVDQVSINIGDNIISFAHADDTHNTMSSFFVINRETMTRTGVGQHNIGHMNSCSYNAKNDCLLIGNNTAKGAEIPPALYIIYNASQLFVNGATVNFNTIDKTVINLFDGDTYLGNYGIESRPNACWGENDNIIYLAMNNNGVMYRCFIGRSVNNLSATKTNKTWGTYSNPNNTDRYNGTLKVLGEYYNSTHFGVNQGINYYKGKIYCAQSHDKVLTCAYKLLSNGTMQLVDSNLIPFFDNMGNPIAYEPEGVFIVEDKLYQTYRGNGKMGIVVSKM